MLNKSSGIIIKTISGQVDKASATKAVDSGSILDWSNQILQKLALIAFMLDVQQLKGQCEASAMFGRQVGRQHLDSKTKKCLRSLLAMASW